MLIKRDWKTGMSNLTDMTTQTRPATRPPAYRLAVPDNTQLARLLARFEPISLAEMDGVALLDRADTKFVMREDHLLSVLAQLSHHYRVLDIDGRRLNHYQTLYFDTPDFAFFRRHHAGALNRYKVRSREYVDTRQSFLEVKLKTNKRRTVKNRLRVPGRVSGFDLEADDFLHDHSPYNAQALEPKLRNAFTRITLVSKRDPERLTLDLGLRFYANHTSADLSGIVIAEVKQDGYSPESDFIQQMRAHGIRSTGFSKYCVGVSLLYPDVKSNNFKPELLLVEKLLKGTNNHAHPR